jgi:hypothetical protein
MSTRDSLKKPHGANDFIPSGLEGNNIPSDFHLPSCGLEDIDKAFFDLFDQQLNFNIENKSKTLTVPVVFATGERFAIVKRRKPLRDQAGALILPVVAIRRSSIDQSPATERLADVGDLVIKRKLSDKDPQYQNLINKPNLKNQDNVADNSHNNSADNPEGAQPGTVNSRRPRTQETVNVQTGKLLAPNLGDNIFEILTIPFPHFITVNYEVTFWTQYMSHMNQLIEKFVSSYTGNRNQFKIETDKGYWFVAYAANTVTNADNFDNFSQDERLVRYTFNMSVPAYIVGTQNPGQMNPIRRYVSAPDVSFEIFTANAPIVEHPNQLPDPTGDIDKFILNDIEQINTAGNEIEDRRIQYLKAVNKIRNPFSGKDEIEYLKVLTRNQRQGETVVSSRIINKIDDI